MFDFWGSGVSTPTGQGQQLWGKKCLTHYNTFWKINQWYEQEFSCQLYTIHLTTYVIWTMNQQQSITVCLQLCCDPTFVKTSLKSCAINMHCTVTCAPNVVITLTAKKFFCIATCDVSKMMTCNPENAKNEYCYHYCHLASSLSSSLLSADLQIFLALNCQVKP